MSTAPPDKRIPDLPAAASVSDADLIVKWDGTQVSGQRTQNVTMGKFGAYITAKIPGTSIAIGTVTTLAAGAQATATLTGAAPNYTLNLGIPQGAMGSGGGNVNASGTPTAGQLALWTNATTIQGQSVPVTVAQGGTNAITASGTALDNISGFASTGFLARTGAGAYSFTATATIATIASPTFTGTPAAPTATAGTNTTQIATTAFVVTSYAPLASPTFTGTPAAPTATVGTNTTQLATTAFVLANAGSGGSAFPSAFLTKSANYTVVASDKNTLFTLSGSFTLTLPSASTMGSGNGIFLSKTDGAGVWAITPTSGTIDGLSSINCYQERYALVSNGTNWMSVNRPKGWINIGPTVIGSAVANVSFSTGFSDTELRDMQFEFAGIVFSASDYLVLKVQKSGSYQSTNYLYQMLTQSNTTNSGLYSSSDTKYSLMLSTFAGTGTFYGTLTALQFASGTLQSITSDLLATSNGIVYGKGMQSTNAAMTAIQFYGQNANNLTAGTFTQKGFRP